MEINLKTLTSKAVAYEKKIEEVNINLHYIHHSLFMLNEVDKPNYVCNSIHLWKDTLPPLIFEKQTNQALNWAINKSINDFMSIVTKSITDTYYPILCSITKQNHDPFLKLELPELLLIMEDMLKVEVVKKEEILSVYQLLGYLKNNKGIVYDNFVLKYQRNIHKVLYKEEVTTFTTNEFLKVTNLKPENLKATMGCLPDNIEKYFEKGKIINLSMEEVNNISLTCAWFISSLKNQINNFRFFYEKAH